MEKRERLQALDGLRAVFGMGIVIYHAGSAFGAPFSGGAGAGVSVRRVLRELLLLSAQRLF